MVSAPNPAVANVPPAPINRRRRSFSLLEVLDAQIRSRFGATLGKLAAIAIVIGFSIALPFAARASAGDASGALYVRGLGWLSWISAGLICFSASGRGDPAESLALGSLASLRGHAASSLAIYEVLAIARRLGRVVGFSALVLGVVLIGSSRSWAALAVHLALAIAGVGYALLLSSVLALVVQIARRGSPEHGRSLFLALIFAPHVGRALFPGLPSVPALFGWLLGFLRSMGGVVA